ncbi:MAG: lysophospholipid acyltransferase family protein [Spirochaetia bacterium]|jgi:1-acyl-sn-glycerol-3-phosphate acyltransferase
MVARYFFKVIRHLFFKSHLSGAQNLKQGEPVILVANHAGSFGPVSVITSLPMRLYPWVASEVTERTTVAKRIQAEFLEQELHLRPPISSYLGKVIGRVCVALMKDIDAIPVYVKSKKILDTVQSSLALLEQGKNILVFAEDSTRKINDVLGEFRTGFAHVAKLYYEKTMKAVQFLPVAVNKKVGRIRIGKPIRFDASNAFSVEKERLKKELQERIWDLYCSMEADGGLSKEPLFATDQ